MRDRVELWSHVAMEGVTDGLNLKGIYDRIILEDPVLGLNNSEEARRTIYQSLLGFMEYAKWVMRGS